MSKRTSHTCVNFIGMNASGVTGSQNLVSFMNYKILLDCGGYQSSNDEEDYKINSKFHKDLKPAQLDAVIISHLHIDHSLLVPMLFSKGADCPIYIPKGTKGLLTYIYQDSVKIFEKNFERFKRKPLYTQADVDAALNHMCECELHEKVVINDNVSFTYYNAKHIVKARQILLELFDGINTKKIGYTGDISDKVESYYLSEFEPLPPVDLLIAECTYSNSKRLNKSKDRRKDMEKLDSAIKQSLQNRGKVLIPTFTLNRLQEILTILYTLYKGNKKIKVLIDSPLGMNICSVWKNAIDKNHELWHDTYNCENFYWVKSFADSVLWSKVNEPMIIVTGGGMLQASRGIFWSKKLLGDKNNTIVFTGYSTPTSTASQIKSGELSEIKIDGTLVSNKASSITLNSLSGHMDYEELLNYYTTASYNKIALVHSDFEDKIEFSEELKKRLSKANRSSKVICTNRESRITV